MKCTSGMQDLPEWRLQMSEQMLSHMGQELLVRILMGSSRMSSYYAKKVQAPIS